MRQAWILGWGAYLMTWSQRLGGIGSRGPTASCSIFRAVDLTFGALGPEEVDEGEEVEEPEEAEDAEGTLKV